MSFNFLMAAAPVLILIAVLLGVIIVLGVKRAKNPMVRARGTVREIKRAMAANPTMVKARNVDLSYAQELYAVQIDLDNGQSVMLNISEAKAQTLAPGMRGIVCYRGNELVKFAGE